MVQIFDENHWIPAYAGMTLLLTIFSVGRVCLPVHRGNEFYGSI
jgi:hypothetical protein